MAIRVVVWKDVVYAYTHVKLEESKKKSFWDRYMIWYSLWYASLENVRNGVVILVPTQLKDDSVEVKKEKM